MIAAISLELERAWALILPPLAVLLGWWLLRERHVRTVPTTFLWQRVGAARGRPRGSLALLLLLLLWGSALTRPVLFIEERERRSPPLVSWNAIPGAGERPVAEIILPAGGGETDVELIVDGKPVLSRRVALDPASATLVTERIGAPIGAPVRLRVGGSEVLRTRVPPRAPIPAVEDRTGSPAVRDVLRALERNGRLRQVAEGAEVIVLRNGDEPAGDGAAARIILPPAGAAAGALLPIPDPGMVPHPLIDGLEARRWTIPHHRRIDPGAPVETVLGSSHGDLISRGEGFLLLHFEPAETDLPELPAWPVLWGRIIEELGASSPPPSAARRSSVPRVVILLAALLLIGVTSTGHRIAWLLVLLTAATLLLPAVPAGSPRRRILASSDAADAATTATEILEAARRLPGGGILVVPGEGALPLDESAWLAELAARHVTIEGVLAERQRPRLVAEPRVLVSGGGVSLHVLDADGPVRVEVRGPQGEFSEVAAAEDLLHEPDAAGLWQYRLIDGNGRTLAGTVVEVLPAIPVQLWTGTPTAGMESLFDDESFAREVVVPDAELSLPDPPRRAIIALDGVDPARLPEPLLARLQGWIEEGGTLVAAAAPPFHEDSPAKERLSALLPAPLPPPPRMPESTLGVVLLDLSGSMLDRSLEIVSGGVRALLEGTPLGGRWGICGFRERAGWIAPPGSPIDRSLIESIVSGLAAQGGTRLDRALDFVMAELAEEGAGQSLIILTDGRAVPADWSSYGAGLRRLGVEVHVIGVGPKTAAVLLRELARSAGGTFVTAATPGEATRLLRQAVERPPGPWIGAEGELQAASLHPLLASVPRHLPRPLRLLHHRATADALPLFVDGRGRAALLVRQLGRGRSVLWCSGLDAESIPHGSAGTRILSALTSIAAAATRQEPRVARRLTLREDDRGDRWIAVERLHREPAIDSCRVGIHGRDGVPLSVFAPSPSVGFLVPVDPATAELADLQIEWRDERHLALPPGPLPQGEAWQRLAARTRGHAPRRGTLPVDLLWVPCAMLILFTTRGRRGFRGATPRRLVHIAAGSRPTKE